MATRRTITTGLSNRLDDDHVYLAMAVNMEFDSGHVRLWNGAGDLSVSVVNELGNTVTATYIGAGGLLAIGDIKEEIDLKSTGVTLSLSGMDTTILNMALTENYQNRVIQIFLLFLHAGSNELAGNLTMFSGRMQAMTITDDPSTGVTISMAAENRLIDLQRPSNLRYTNSSQQAIATGDTSFQYVAQMEDLEIVWGKEGSSGSAGLSNFTASGGNKWF